MALDSIGECINHVTSKTASLTIGGTQTQKIEEFTVIVKKVRGELS